MMMASFSKIPELSLSEDEAKQLTAAINRVASFYDIGASEKTLAWLNLAVCAGGIYGTRVFAYHLRTKAEEETRKQQQRPLFTMPPPPAANPAQQAAL